MKFNQKIALITGGSRGLGKNMALRPTAYGADAIIAYHRHEDEADADNQFKSITTAGWLPALDGSVKLS